MPASRSSPIIGIEQYRRHLQYSGAVFFGHEMTEMFWNDRKNSVISVRLSERLMNTVTTSCNTTVRQTTEMSQRPKCFNKKWPKYLSKKTAWGAV